MTSVAPKQALFCAVDRFYVKQLAVMLRSCAEHYTGPLPLPVYIVDGGLSPDERSKIEQSLQAFSFELTWCLPGSLSAAEFFVSNHITLSTYFRLFLADVIPADIERVVYIDADTAVLGDVRVLFDMDLGDKIVSARPQAAPADWTFSPRESYFNAGVLVINATEWRSQQVGELALKFAREHGAANTEWDQGALNVVLNKKWVALGGNWNLEPTPGNLASITTPGSAIGIVHFLGVGKPWHTDYPHTKIQQFYFEWLDKTAWRGWRPPRGVEWMARKIAHVPFVKALLNASSGFRRLIGLNYSTLYRFFRGR